MKIKAKSCSCKACKKHGKPKKHRKLLQKNFRQAVKRATYHASKDPEGYEEVTGIKLSYFWA